MNVIRYFRSASSDQAEESIAYQEKATREYCDANEYKIIEDFADIGYSGNNLERPGLTKMMNKIKNAPMYDIVLVTNISRISRNVNEAWWFSNELKKRDVKLLCIQDIEDDLASFIDIQILMKNIKNMKKYKRGIKNEQDSQ